MYKEAPFAERQCPCTLCTVQTSWNRGDSFSINTLISAPFLSKYLFSQHMSSSVFKLGGNSSWVDNLSSVLRKPHPREAVPGL